MAQLATYQNWKFKILPSTDSYLHAKTLRVLIDSSQRHQSNWVRATTGHTQPKLVVSDPSFCRWLSSCKKYKVWIDFFQWYWWSKAPTVSLNQRHNWPHLTKSSSPRSFLPLVVVSMQKINGIHLFFAEILMIAVYCNLIEHEAQLATPKQKWWSQIQLFVDSYLRVKIWSIEWLLPKILMIKEYCNLTSWQHFKALTELSDFFQAWFSHRVKSRIWMQLPLFANSFFLGVRWQSGPEGPSQLLQASWICSWGPRKPKCWRAIKVAKEP